MTGKFIELVRKMKGDKTPYHVDPVFEVEEASVSLSGVLSTSDASGIVSATAVLGLAGPAQGDEQTKEENDQNGLVDHHQQVLVEQPDDRVAVILGEPTGHGSLC